MRLRSAKRKNFWRKQSSRTPGLSVPRGYGARFNPALLRRADFSAAGFCVLRCNFCGTAAFPSGSEYKIDQVQPDAVLDLAFPQVAQTRRPLPVLHQIIGDAL